jgi:hypothetical protein
MHSRPDSTGTGPAAMSGRVASTATSASNPIEKTARSTFQEPELDVDSLPAAC